MRLTLSTSECERVLRGFVDRVLTWRCFKGRLIQMGPKEGLEDLLMRASVHAVASLLVAGLLRDGVKERLDRSAELRATITSALAAFAIARALLTVWSSSSSTTP